MEEKPLLEDRESMIRLSHEGKLMKDCTALFEFLSQKEGCLPRKFKRRADKYIIRNFNRGMKQIEKKIPVFIELPKLEKKGNGMYAVNYEKVNNPSDGEIVVNTPVVQTQHPPDIFYSEREAQEFNPDEG